MKKTALLSACLLALWPGMRVCAQEQADSLAIGGAEELAPYEEVEEEIAADEHEASPVLRSIDDRTDSLALIPGYALYGGWNTGTIFERSTMAAKITDTVNIRLTHAACDHTMPVCGELTSPFGPRRGRMHYGIDLELDQGDPVVAAFEGMVRVSRYNRTFGNVVVVRHSNGLETLYAHLSQRSVEVGDHVEAGTLLGLGGNTGRSFGDHLHFEVRYLDQPIDPQLIFDVTEGELRVKDLTLDRKFFADLERTRAAAAASGKRYHTVRKGDTLSAIARRNRTTVSRLCKLNRISTRSKLRIGQRIRVS
ncbi:MAG: peptidoglycan DD-metalloendopeptidase family protein [Flavobacteriales bacterium]|nr:peptidoglycan DD-metalloendopeptidase family protein [Flavobacteriales bacterium]